MACFLENMNLHVTFHIIIFYKNMYIYINLI